MCNNEQKFECSSKQKCIKNVKNTCIYHDWCLYKIVKDEKVKNKTKSS